ncbi:YlaC family protein [[Erwinia] mediterraneensis]|uniref:YlaC family protein n=1 Tax=[Erwinia] mediterraneensis TaxID=2161819 RepID=UPI001030CE7A|nr:YlaC family protein [[Erwinia] mediterraneensis]
MEAIKQILLDEIDRLNREEKRDNRPRFSLNFLKNHPGLWAVMYLCYGLCVALIFTTDMLGWPAFWFATLFVLVMSFLMLLDINPRYRFEDIDALDLRVCYNGEWYYIRPVSEAGVAAIMNNPETPERVKSGIQRLLAQKGEVDFYDIYYLTWGHKQASQV